MLHNPFNRLIGLALLVMSALALSLPVMAQTQDVITLNDTSPAIEAVITLPPDTSGVISLQLAGAKVTLKDANGQVVFSANDPRIHALELNIAPNTGEHTLVVERIDPAIDANVTVQSLSQLTMATGLPAPDPNNPTLGLNQEQQIPLDSVNRGGTWAADIPANTTGTIGAQFAGANANAQVVDSTGLIIAEARNGNVDGVVMTLDGGQYDVTLLGSPAGQVVAGLQVVPNEQALLNAPAAPANTAPVATNNTGTTTTNTAPVATNNTGTTTTDNTASQGECIATVVSSAANLRSGPGTAYSVLGYAYANQELQVGGTNPESNWVVVGTDGGSAWVSRSITNLSGSCNSLSVFNIPLRDAATAQINVVPQSSTYYDNGGGEHEGGDGGEGGEGGDD